MSEIVFKIIQRALAGDIANVKEYALLLADELAESGESYQAELPPSLAAGAWRFLLQVPLLWLPLLGSRLRDLPKAT